MRREEGCGRGAADQQSLAIGKGGQNVRLAAKTYRLENRYTFCRRRICWSWGKVKKQKIII